MTVLEIVKKYLETNGYDGLVAEDRECACETDDLAPCGEIRGDCEAGHRVEDVHVDESGYQSWGIVAGKK